MMGSRISDVQIIAMLKEQEAGMSASEDCRKHRISSANFCKFKARYSRLKVERDARRLKLEEEWPGIGFAMCKWRLAGDGRSTFSAPPPGIFVPASAHNDSLSALRR